MPTLPSPPAGSCRFGPLTVDFDERVLAPRPWTLQQSRWAAELAGQARPGPLLELCAGAGHIGLAAARWSGRPLVAVESYPVAAGFARANAEANGCTGYDLRTTSMDRALDPTERFPIVIADPPYLPTGRVADWPADPRTAIDGGADGLRLIRMCLRVAAAHLDPGGWLLLQVAGPAQADQVTGLLHRTPFARHALRVIDDSRALILLDRP